MENLEQKYYYWKATGTLDGVLRINFSMELINEIFAMHWGLPTTKYVLILL